MRVLLACERTQRVCIEFRRLGHEAFSCDVEPCCGGYPEWHIQGDVLDILDEHWDLVVAFPPCTDLSGACGHLWPVKLADGRIDRSFEFVKRIWGSSDVVCIENPQGWLNSNWKKPDQTIHPNYFGDPYLKRTCLWLKGLQPLRWQRYDNMWCKATWVEPVGYWVSSSNRRDGRLKNGLHHSADKRAETFPAIARAMAGQWGR